MDSSDFPDWLENKLKEKRISQSELARRAGISRQTVSDYINRKRPYPDERSLIRIADGLGISSLEIYRAAGLLPELPTIDAVRQEVIDQKLADLTPDQLDEVIEYIDFITHRKRQTAGMPISQKNTRQGTTPGEVVKK